MEYNFREIKKKWPPQGSHSSAGGAHPRGGTEPAAEDHRGAAGGYFFCFYRAEPLPAAADGALPGDLLHPAARSPGGLPAADEGAGARPHRGGAEPGAAAVRGQPRNRRRPAEGPRRAKALCRGRGDAGRTGHGEPLPGDSGGGPDGKGPGGLHRPAGNTGGAAGESRAAGDV